jgi:endonuclease/exonuclease/phosphatase family metal-dependent hydrolase
MNGSGTNIFSKFPFTYGSGDNKSYNAYRETWAKKAGGMENSSTASQQDAISQKGFMLSCIKIQGITVYVYNIHTDAGSLSEDIAARNDNFAQVSRHIATLSSSCPVIVMGDFNESYFDSTGNVQKLCRDNNLTDLAHELYPSDTSWKIDRILYRGGGNLVFTPQSFSMKSQSELGVGMTYSDHNAAEGVLGYYLK